MKLRYFILPIFIISIMIYIIDKDTIIFNKEMVSDTKNISYPFFNNDNIDIYINSYLSNYSNIDNIIIDYDYYYINDNYYVTFYKYINNDNIIRSDSDVFVVNTNNNLIEKYYGGDILYQYDFVNNKKIDGVKKLVAFTFDDGPNYNTNRIIDILNKYNVKATFFVMGRNIKGNEDILKKMKYNGMEIGNHTFNHLLLTKYNGDKIINEINNTSDLIFDTVNSRPCLLRPSYGSVNKRIKFISEYPIITWSVDTLDWKYHSSKKIVNEIVNNVKDGDIILMHDIYSATANAVDSVIPMLKDMGYDIVTVSDLFYYKGISLEKGMVYSSAK